MALLTLPCPVLAVTGRITGGADGGFGLAGPLHPALARRLLADLRLRLPGRVVLRAAMPVGGGAGSSTAALVAVARLAGWRGPALTLARACVRAEAASDPLMLPDAGRLLWASREGRVIGTLPPLGRCDIVGGFFGPPQRTPAQADFPDISDLVAAWRATDDLRRQAALAAESATRRWGADGVMARLAQQTGALGWVAAHTGAARGLIFAPGRTAPHWRAAMIEAGGHGLVAFRAGV